MVTLTGVVREEGTGKPVTSATVRLVKGVARAITGDSGAYRLDGLTGERARIVASAEGRVDQTVLLHLADGATTEARHDFALERAGVINVLVTDRAGAPVGGALIGLAEAPADVEFTYRRIKADGRARFERVSRVRPYHLTCRAAGFRFERGINAVFEPANDMADVRIVLVPNEKQEGEARVFEGRVTNKSGDPLTSITVGRGPFYSPTGAGKTLTNDAGEYRLVADPSFPEEEAFLAVFGQGWAMAVKKGIRPGTAKDPAKADFVLEPGHRVKGVVQGADGRPIAGAQVSVSSRLEGESQPLYSPHLRTPAKTDEEGRFEIGDLPGWTALAFVRAQGWTTLKGQPLKLDGETIIALRRSGVIRGKVLDAGSGQPVKDFSVRVHGTIERDDRDSLGESFHTGDGRFALRDVSAGNPYCLVVEATGYMRDQKAQLMATDEGSPAETIFRLEKGRPITGVVVNGATGLPLSDVMVCFDPEESAGMENPKRLFARTNVKGGFTFLEGRLMGLIALRLDGYQRLAIAPGDRAKYAATTESTVRVAATSASAFLRIPLSRSGGTIAGVFSLRGAPQARGLVSLCAANPRGGARPLENAAVECDPSGAFAFGDLPPGAYDLFASSRNDLLGGVSKRIELVDGESKTVNLGEEVGVGGAVLSGHVRIGGKPVPGYEVDLSMDLPSERVRFTARTDVEGAYRIEGLPNGAYKAHVWKNPPSEIRQPEFRDGVTVQGETNKDFMMEAWRRVTARLAFLNGLPAEQRAGLRLARLSVINASLIHPGVDIWGDSQIENGQVSFAGRFDGIATITLYWADATGHQNEIRLPKQFRVNNLEMDQDLGDIVLPAPGQGSLDGRVIDENSTPIEGAKVWLRAASLPQGEVGPLNSGKGGLFRFDGLKNQLYSITILKTRQMGSDDGLVCWSEDRAYIKGATANDFRVKTKGFVMARLVFDKSAPPSLRSQYEDAALTLAGPHSPQRGAIKEWGVCRITGEWLFFEGTYKGDYWISFAVRTEKSSTMNAVIQRPFALDNQQTAQDVGDIKAPVFHRVTGRLAFLARLKEPIRSSFTAAQLDLVDEGGRPAFGISASEPPRIRQTMSKIEDGRVTFIGQFKGKYRLEFYFRSAGRPDFASMPLKTALDNLESDQDLGDIELPPDRIFPGYWLQPSQTGVNDATKQPPGQ